MKITMADYWYGRFLESEQRVKNLEEANQLLFHVTKHYIKKDIQCSQQPDSSSSLLVALPRTS